MLVCAGALESLDYDDGALILDAKLVTSVKAVLYSHCVEFLKLWRRSRNIKRPKLNKSSHFN